MTSVMSVLVCLNCFNIRKLSMYPDVAMLKFLTIPCTIN